MSRVREIVERIQPGMRQMNVSGEVVALAPGFGGAFNIVEDVGIDCRPVGRGQECQHFLFTAFQAFQLACTLGRHQDRARA